MASRRRFLQYGLRSLLLIVVVCAVLFAWILRERRRYESQLLLVEDLPGPRKDIMSKKREPQWLGIIVGKDHWLTVMGLNLHGRMVSDESISRLNDLPGLETLVLYNASVTDDGVPHLNKLKGLRELYLEQTRISEAAVRELQAALPDCKIVFEPAPEP